MSDAGDARDEARDEPSDARGARRGAGREKRDGRDARSGAGRGNHDTGREGHGGRGAGRGERDAEGEGHGAGRGERDARSTRRYATLRRNNEESNAFVRSCIETALVQLMETTPFERITVSDIARKAGVSRNAYYRNYASKEDILAGFLDGVCAEMEQALAAFDPVGQTREAWDALLAAVRAFAPRYRLLLLAGYGDLVRERTAQVQCAAQFPDAGAQRYASLFWAGAMCAVLEAWVRADFDVPADELAATCSALMLDGVRAGAGAAGEREGSGTAGERANGGASGGQAGGRGVARS